MPFTKHIIEPVNISQCPLPAGEPNELECLSNLTLANIIRQLSSLGQHAGRIFDELSADAVKLNTRAQLMHQRLENLKQKCNQLDIQSEEVSLADFQTKKQFKSAIKIEQQIVSRKTMPEAMRLMYNNADPPPALEKLNPYRIDGKDCLKFYTDPDFFFNIWCNELMKDNETRKKDKKNRRSKSDKQPVNAPQTIKSPLLKNGHNGTNMDLTNAVTIPMIMQQSGIKKPINQYDDASYYQQQILLLNQAKQQQQIYFSNNNNNTNSTNLIPDSLKSHYAHPPQLQHNQLKNYDDHLIIPMQHMQTNMSQHYDIYSDSNKLNGSTNITNNNRPKMNTPNHKHTPNGSSTERPILPPPPIPNNQISDLQQIQQQMIKKKLTDITISNNNNTSSNSNNTNSSINNGNRLNGSDFNTQSNLEPPGSYELPPPPSPPSMFGNFSNTNNNGMSHMNGNSYQRHQSLQPKSDNDFDIPLPPPPLDLPDHDSNLGQPISPPLPPPLIFQSTNNINTNNNNNGNGITNSLPPPPPLPPLVESDTTSSSSSLSINNNNNSNSNQTKFNTSINDEVKSARNNYLDDISQRRFQLRSTANVTKQADTSSLADESRIKDTNNTSDNKQPWTKSADVAAIIDFVRNYRPYVRDSSDDDDEDSEWDS